MRLLLLVLAAVVLGGCVGPNKDISATQTTRVLGFDLSQGASGMYHLKFGFITYQQHFAPVSTNQL